MKLIQFFPVILVDYSIRMNQMLSTFQREILYPILMFDLKLKKIETKVLLFFFARGSLSQVEIWFNFILIPAGKFLKISQWPQVLL